MKASKQKTIEGFLRVDWKKEKVTARQTEPSVSELGNNELLAKYRFTVNIPDVDVPTLAAEIDVPEPMVYSATLEALEDREMPEYAQIADTVIADRVDDIRDAGDDGLENIIAGITVQTLRETRGRPRLELVEDYVSEVAFEIHGGGDPLDDVFVDEDDL